VTVLYTPSPVAIERAHITRYLSWLRSEGGLDLRSYDELWRWSVDDVEAFWASIAAFFEVRFSRPAERVLSDRSMPGARWFEGAELNYVDHVFGWPDDRLAVLAYAEEGPVDSLTYGDLRRRVARAAAALRRRGVEHGDRVAAYAPNVVDALVAFLATASLGAVWSACSPDFGATAVLDRFRQIEPRVLLVVDGYRFKGTWHDRRAVVAELGAGLPKTTLVPLADLAAGSAVAGGESDELPVSSVPFEHPLWVLYSSGTTGLPKAIVHGHGGILLEHLKQLSLHMDLGPGDRFFWYSSTGWMMWNLLAGGLLVGSTIVLYDGSPAFPDMGALWRLAEQAEMTYFGVSAPYIQACMKAGVVPRAEADLSRLRGVGSTGAPLPPEGFEWVYDNVHRDLLLGSVSGGTDICSGFVASCPLLPVHAGEIQCRCLGAKVEAYDERGQPVAGEVGELVVTAPLPSMPLFFWNDADGHRYRSSYFETYPGVWRHGDWITITERGSCVISGRSDATLNRGGVRMGTAEVYRVVEALPEVLDSLVVDTGKLWLFVVLAGGTPSLDAVLRGRIGDVLRTQLSPRHVPDEIVAIDEVPRTINGKKMEIPVKRILLGQSVDAVVSPDAMANPDSLAALARAARTVDV
jgi:acetoacetyl-CoA synthetase